MVRIGTAGWSIPKEFADRFPDEGTHLERYAQVFSCVEINSSFYREHRPATYEAWADATPDDFLFSVKLSRYFTQEQRFLDRGPMLDDVMSGYERLGEKWGVLLVQLPPSLAFEWAAAKPFFERLREIYDGVIALEPRHVSWAADDALRMIADLKISKVRADPERCPISANERRAVESSLYYRLHGSPQIYKSRYEEVRMAGLEKRLLHAESAGQTPWCIFDNTQYGFATENASNLQATILARTTTTLTSRERRPSLRTF